MWSRCMMVALLCGVGCQSTPPPPPPQPEPEPEESSEPPPPAPEPKARPTCAELEKGRCMVTEGCEWHSVKKCLDQEKPKTLDKP